MADATQAPPAAGIFCWNELMTRDTDAARDFYSKVFGWTAEEMDMGPAGKYTIMKQGDTQVCGMMKMDGPQFENVPNHWLSYIASDDVDASAAKSEAAGGTICMPPTDIPGIGRFTVVSDPTGATIGYFQSTASC